ncbi:MAG: glycosyltransferase [Candidatus Marsarchaeota archaeon]|nr:glycosyltransferase [Candidatus Marsarchaeota archaeon]
MEKEKLRIAFYTDSFLPARDGVVTSIIAFRKELEKRGHEVRIFTTSSSGNKDSKGYKGVYYVRGVKFRNYPQYTLALPPIISYAQLNEFNPDIIHSHSPFMMGFWALAMGKINKIPLVGTFHTMFTDRRLIEVYGTKNKYANKAMWKYSWKYIRFYYSRCNAVMAPSKSVSDILNKKGITNTYIVPNGVDTKRFNPNVDGSKVRKKLAKGNEKIVLYVGRISREKRIETLLKSAKILRDEKVRFVIVGTGPSMAYYTRMAERLGVSDRVTFTGFVSDKVLPKYYAACDVFCIPSTFETQGIVSIEAMATGKPVVGADSLALSEVIKNGKNGEKFPENDSIKCAAKIKKVINNVSSYKEIVNSASKYSVESTTDELLNVYKKVLNEFTV